MTGADFGVAVCLAATGFAAAAVFPAAALAAPFAAGFAIVLAVPLAAALADGAFGVSAPVCFAPALAFAGVFADFAICPSLVILLVVAACLMSRHLPDDRDGGVADSPRNPVYHLCIATIGDRASLAPAARQERFAVKIFRRQRLGKLLPVLLAASSKSVDYCIGEIGDQ
ncbi:hypothetical protein [Mesorhizobium helmanticense]|uniref:hypothetical protein n=1 Tax=Mesorhizobium helmanticense TaxID=1776423 RepID=UPI001ABF612B|nr:hypothetical protein [Mesorhizobium helmanticense]